MNARITAPIVCAALLSPLLVARPALALSHDALKGTWSATVTPDEGATGKDHADTLTFTNGYQFSSEFLAKQGYEPVHYEDRPSPIGVAATFEVIQTNKAGDTAHWQGTATGGEMTGTLVITPKDGAPANYTFKADRK
jgi:hypothetical protein